MQYWKDIQAKHREREEEQASSHRDRPQHFRIHTDESQETEHHEETERHGGRSSGWSSSRGPSRKERERETSNGPYWCDDWPDQDRWSWRNPHPRDDADEDWGPEEEEEYEDTEEDDAEDRDLSADSGESYENATSESSPICKPRKKNRTPAPPASKRSRSTQVSDEFVRRQQEAESPQTAPTEDLCATQIQRLHRVVELLEQLAQAGLPMLLSTYYRSGDFTKHHNTFHGHPSTAEFPRVGNWNLSLTGSLLCPHLRGIYNNVETFGSFMESFTVCNAVQLIAKMMDTCTPATYDAMKWKSNPAEFIHVIRTHEVAPAPNPGEAGADNLRHLLYDTAPDLDSPPTPDPAPETPAAETWIPEMPPPETLLLQLLNKPMAEQTVDSSSSHSEDVKMLTQREPTHPVAAPPPDQAHKLIGRPQSSTTTEPSL